MKRLQLLVCISYVTCIVAFTQIKVACVGNSITYGATIENREQNSYPAQLGKLLGTDWLVSNFGVSGATLLKKGNRPYWQQKAFTDAKEFNPDVVIIKLGTNDTKPQNWVFKDEFVADYISMINEFKVLPSKPFIVVCIPVPAFPEHWGIRDSIITTDITPLIQEIIKNTNVELIDLHTPLQENGDWFPDKIHPNAMGAGKIAAIIEKNLVQWKTKITQRK